MRIMKKLLILLIVTISVFMISCGAFKHYEDTNGSDDYSLQYITEEMLIKENSGLRIASVSTTTNEGAYKVIKQSCSRFDGVEELYVVKSGSYEVIVTFNVEQGNGRLVLTDGNSVIHEFGINSEEETFSFTAYKKYYFKVAGEDLGYDITIKIAK